MKLIIAFLLLSVTSIGLASSANDLQKQIMDDHEIDKKVMSDLDKLWKRLETEENNYSFEFSREVGGLGAEPFGDLFRPEWEFYGSSIDKDSYSHPFLQDEIDKLKIGEKPKVIVLFIAAEAVDCENLAVKSRYVDTSEKLD